MIKEEQRNEEGKYEFPYNCPICNAELNPDENIDTEIHNGKSRSILRCGNGDCRYSKVLDEKTEKEIAKEMEEGTEEKTEGEIESDNNQQKKDIHRCKCCGKEAVENQGVDWYCAEHYQLEINGLSNKIRNASASISNSTKSKDTYEPER